MARSKSTNESTEAIAKASSSDEIARFKLGEIGNLGIAVFNGVTQEEIKRELNHPESINTYKLMSMHPAINAPLSLFENMVCKADFRFIPPKDATEEEKNRTKIVSEMFEDMEHTLEDFIHEAMTSTIYGWSVHEKVWRKRSYASGSMYNDGLIAPKKLALRAQKSIQKFIFDSTGNEVIGVTQDTAAYYDPYNRFTSRPSQITNIPRNKFMLITLGKDRSNPFGVSPLRDVYQPWKYLQAIEELEAQSIVKDVNGLPVLSAPVQFMSADASPEQKAQLEMFKNIIRNLQQGAQSGVILPSAYDPETRQPLFKLELLSQDGKKNFDLNKVKEYYRTMIFIGMGADILLMGSTNAGSFALGSIKNTSTGNVAEGYLRRIIQVINNDLIKDIYSLNGWDISRRCKMDIEGFDVESMDEVGKFIQRVTSVGLMPKTEEVVNLVLDTLSLDPLPEGTDVSSVLSDNTSRAADGFKTAGNGTSTNSISDTSTMNSENAA